MSSDGFLYLAMILCMLPDYNQQYKKTDRCPSGIIEWRKRESEFKCPVEKPYHCLLFYNSSQLYEACLATSPIEPEKAGCPRIYKIKDNDPVLVSTLSKCPVANTECPPSYHKGYLSNQLYMYPACFMNSSARIQMTSDTIAEIHATERKVATRCPNQVPKENNHLPIIIGLGIALCIAVIVIIIIVVVLFRKRRVQENKRFTKTLGNNESIPGEGHGNIDDSAESVQLMPTTNAIILDSAYPQDETSIKEKESTNHQHADISDEDLVNRVFRGVLDISDGIVSYSELMMHFVQTDECSDITGDLEIILKGNGNVFRLLEDQSICFVIAYLSDAEVCDNYNQASLGRRCTDTSCWKFHICSFYVKGTCNEPNCQLSHTYGDAHNQKVKDSLGFRSYSDSDLNNILLNCYPKICSTPDCITEEDCPFLHICSKFCFGKCPHGSKCRLNHTFRTEHNVWILNAYGISEDDIWTGSSLATKLTIAKKYVNQNI